MVVCPGAGRHTRLHKSRAGFKCRCWEPEEPGGAKGDAVQAGQPQLLLDVEARQRGQRAAQRVPCHMTGHRLNERYFCMQIQTSALASIANAPPNNGPVAKCIVTGKNFPEHICME